MRCPPYSPSGPFRAGEQAATPDGTCAGAQNPSGTGLAFSPALPGILRISASLDLDTVLREAVDGARGLTGARLGMIATVDESGAQEGFVESGFTPGEAAELAAWPDGARLFAHLRELSATLRVDDLAAYVRGLELTPAPSLSKAFQGTPMQYRGVDFGSFFLADKAHGGTFSRWRRSASSRPLSRYQATERDKPTRRQARR